MSTIVTGNIKSLGVAGLGNSFVRFWLRGTAGNQPRVSGESIIAPSQGGLYFFDIPADSNGVVSGTIYSTRDASGVGAGEIEVGGSHVAAYYGMQVWYRGKSGPEIPVHAKFGVVLDISNVTPITTIP